MSKTMVHLHNHTEYSVLDGKGKVKLYVARAKQLGMPALGIMDHGNLGGTFEHYKECLANDIEPILGEEFYFVPDAVQNKEDDAERFHIGLIARNEAGFRILCELSTESHKFFHRKPLLDRKMIEALSPKDRAQLVCLSGCANSIISKKLLKQIDGSANAELLWWKRMFKHFHIELMHHDTDFDKILNRRLLKAAARHELPWVVTNDPHYVMKEEHAHHDALLAVGTAGNLDDPNRFRFDGSGYHLRSYREMERAFIRNYGREVWKPGAAETLHIARACRTRIRAWDSRTWHIPKFPGVDEPNEELARLAWAGLRERGLDGKSKYRKRVKHELRQFKKAKMADFLLICRDNNVYADSVGIRVGPGRGSVCGTLVGYLIGIHKVDSVKYDLLFERFLNPERPKMPDIDQDFQASRRGEMIDYEIRKYGGENTMRVGAFQTMGIASAFRSLATAYGIDFKSLNRLSALIEEDTEGEVILPAEIEEGYPELHATLEAFRGLKKGLSRHPAGVIVLDENDPIKELLPIEWIPNPKVFVSQFDLKAAAGMGLMKQDFLALRTLDTIEECVRLVEERHGVTLDPDSWIPDEEEDDDKIYKMLARGRVEGVFQMEGGTNRRGIKEINCQSFEDIVACTSLYRKGPLDDKADDRFLKNKKDGKVRVAHKSLKQFLGSTWGEMIYQEQMFEILHTLAGFSWARVDDAKTYMALKDPVLMATLKDEAVKGFMEISGMSETTAEKVWDKIQACAGYLFNRSHAVAYSLLTYQTARLKYLYPLEYMAALLRTVDPDSKEKKAKREQYMSDAIRMGFKILPPDVNLSDVGFTPVGKNKLMFGLADIKDVGPSAIRKLVEYRKDKSKRLARRGYDKKKVYRTVAEVKLRCTNKKVLAALMAAGALKEFGIPHDPALQEDFLSWQFDDPLRAFRKKLEKKIALPGQTTKKRVTIAGEIRKAEVRKTKTGGSYVTWIVRWEPGKEYRINVWDSASSLHKLQKGSVVVVRGAWNEQYSNIGVGDADDVDVLKKIKAPKEAA